MIEDEKNRIKKRKDFLKFEIERSSKMLENFNFIKKASIEKINEEKEKIKRFKKELKEINEK